jgi:hypothetical protein
VGRTYAEIDERWREWIARQQMFFVATAPLAADGHVNVSPKGPIGTLRVLDGHTVAYLDVVGSGAETIAHLRENGRIVVMFCAFEGPPRILRLHGRGEVVLPDDPRFADLLERCDFEEPGGREARRAVVIAHVSRIADSCGYGVPLMSYEGERPHYDAWAQKRVRSRGTDALTRYQEEHNSEAIDGLPAVPVRAGRVDLTRRRG